MFEYAAGSPSASQRAKELLGDKGLFQENQGQFLKERFGARFFYHLTLAEPAAALSCLKRTISVWSKEELLSLDQTRGLIVSSLEYIALWRDLFQDAARLLLILGEAENQTYSNNASGVFAELFQLSEHKELSKSEASPSQRIQILRETLNSNSSAARTLGLEACRRALSWKGGGIIRDTHRIVGKRPDLWYPKIYKELFDAYREIWSLLISSLDFLDSDGYKIAYKNILESARDLARINALNEMVLNDLEKLSKRDVVENQKESLIATVVRFVHDFGKEAPPELFERWNKLQKELTGGNYHDLLIRYIAMDLIIDRVDQDGNISNAIEKRIQKLVDYGLSNPAELKAELAWLMANDFYRARGFAVELGRKDVANSFLADIAGIAKELQGKGTSAEFLGGYLQASHTKDKNAWTNYVRTLSNDDDLVYATPSIVWYSRELTDELASLLISLAKQKKINLVSFSNFAYGDYLKRLSPKIIEEWFDVLLLQNDITFTLIALSTYFQLYIYSIQGVVIPEDLTIKLLTHPTLFAPSAKTKYDQMAEYNWKGVAEKFIEQYPDRSLEISAIVLEHFCDDDTLFGSIFSDVHNIVGRIAQLNPIEVWKQITKYLDPPYDARAFGITYWLHGRTEIFGQETASGPLDIFPTHAVWEWVEQDVSQRAWYLATFVPKALFRSTEKVCWARELLVKYGDLESVRSSLHANFGSGSWSGSASQYHRGKLKDAMEFRKDETDLKVIPWLDEYIKMLENEIQREEIREEREDF